MNINCSFKDELIKFILSKPKFKKRYTKKHPNKKYTIEDIVNAILVFLKSGITWDDITKLGNINGKTVYWHFSDFKKAHIFEQFYTRLINLYFKYQANEKLKIQMIDSTFIKNERCIATLGRNKYYKNKKGLKISCITDSEGIPFSIIFNNGTIYDSKFVNANLLNVITVKPLNVKNKIILGDKGYDAKHVRKSFESYEYNCIIDYNKRRTKDPDKIRYLTEQEKKIYNKRIKIENSFSWLKKNRRVSQIYEADINTYIQLVFLAYSKILYNKM